ncbi:MAG TPA: type II CAAX endopeptidase family protein [Gemmatimonadaceae bacterium]|nr:type II CAAX endopeptidase family protein [Gemmatimonadaceae bacterium]
MRTRDFFYAPSGALRAPWRIGLFLAIALAAYTALAIVLAALWPGLITAAAVDLAALYGFGLIGVGAVLFAHLVCLRWVDRLSWSHVAMARAAADPRTLGHGFLVGGLALAAPAGVLLLIGWLEIRPVAEGSWTAFAAMSLIALAPAALFEELLLRGYPFAVLRESWGWKPALLLTSAVFGVWHGWNPSATPLAIAMVTLAGVFLGAVLLATGSLYAAWTAHLAWNWVLVGVLHTEVSGIEIPVPDYRMTDVGPAWATGGSWGPEGGLFAGLGMIAATGYLLSRWRRREQP